MADGERPGGERTEASTQRHADQAREAGQAPVSRELATFVSLVAVVLVIAYQSQAAMRHLLPVMVGILAHAGDAHMLGSAQLQMTVRALANALLPIVVVTILAGSAAVLLQTKLLLHLGSAAPKLTRVNPMGGMKRIFGFKGFVEIVKSVIKLGLLIIAMWIALRSDLTWLTHLSWQDPRELLAAVARPAYHVLIGGLCAQGLIAGADFIWVRFHHARDLRMSHQDIRDETKDTEGNPHVKARIHRIRILRARKRMMAKVPTATVVITNPTHYAVALIYDRINNPAPRVVAKGADAVAARIRKVAQTNRVPIVANPPLARALYRLDLDSEIPAEHYRVVAEIIAYVWRLRRPGEDAL
jgi:flagellar biosynthetic protein FlhB